MAVTSLFTNRNALRQILPTQATAQVFREVRTEDELRVALQPLRNGGLEDLVANTGRRIVITAPITLKSPIIIDASLPGTIIESHGFLPITPDVDGIDCIVVRAQLCMIRGVLILSNGIDVIRPATASFDRGVAFEGGTAGRVEGVSIFGARRPLVADSASNRVSAIDCTFASVDGDNDGVFLDGNECRITGCSVDGNGSGVDVRIDANAVRCTVLGNVGSGKGVVSDTSGGFNVIACNADIGTIVNNATDAVGLNT